MSVLVRYVSQKDSKSVIVYVKGAPEKIVQLCRPETGVCACVCVVCVSMCVCMYVCVYVCVCMYVCVCVCV